MQTPNHPGMGLSPVELRHERPRMRPFGYRKADVDHLLESATDAYEVVWRERGDLDDRAHEPARPPRGRRARPPPPPGPPPRPGARARPPPRDRGGDAQRPGERRARRRR